MSNVPSLTINTNLIPATLAPSEQKRVLLFGQHITTDGVLTPGSAGFFNYFMPTLLPAFSTGDAALAYLETFGINVKMGIDFTLTLPAPTTVVSTNGLTTLTWSSTPSNFSTLVGFNLSGTLVQGVLTAPVYKALFVSGVATMQVVGTIAYVTAGDMGDPLTLTGTNNIDYPDPNLTDPIALMVWDFYQTALTANSSGFGAPQAYISMLSDREDSITPVDTPIVLGNPAAVVNGTGVSSLTFPISTEGLGYLPSTPWGATTVTQSIALPTGAQQVAYYANGVFLSGSSAGGGILYSLDGIIWTATNNTTSTVNGFYYNGSAFVAATAAGLYQSVDGITWQVTNKSTGVFNNVYYANSKWVAVSTVGIWYSPELDGSGTWTVTTGAATGIFNQAVYVSAFSKWYATCSVDIYSSTDGITWAAMSYSVDGFEAIAFANGMLQVGSDNNDGIVYSTDGSNFIASDLTTKEIVTIQYNGSGVWMAGTTDGTYYSTNGSSWIVCTNGNSGVVNSILFVNNIWIITTTVGIYYTLDGITLTESSITTGNYLSSASNGSEFVTVGAPGITYSSNGTVWASNATATGTYNGYSIEGSNVVISVMPTADEFSDNNPVTIVLDNLINGFDFLNNIDIQNAVLQFPINEETDVTEAHADFYNGILAYNNGNQVLNKHYWCYGIAGNTTILPSAAITLYELNSYLDILVTYPYIAQFGDIPYENDDGTVASGRFCSGVSYMLANGDTPYPNLTGATIGHFPVSSLASTISYQTYPGGTGSIAIGQGWLPLVPNSFGVVSFLQSNTTLITIPNTSTPNTEFSFTHIYDSVRWYKRELATWYSINSVLPNNQGTVLISPGFLTKMRAAMISIARKGENLGMFENVSLYLSLFTVVQDSENPNQVDANAPCQIIPGLNSAVIDINVFSSLFQFNTTQA